MKNARLATLGLLLCVAVAPAMAQVDYYSPQKVREFAEYLVAEGDYLRAAAEYERLYVLTSSSPGRDSLLYTIARCYGKAGAPERALLYYERIRHEYPNSELLDAAVVGTGWAHFQQKDYTQSLRFLQDHPIRSADHGLQQACVAAVDRMFLRQWEQAEALLSPHDLSDAGDDSLGVMLHRLARDGVELPCKSMVKAGLLSGVVPGAGKIYAGRFSDGLYSLLTVGLTGWQTYEGFRHDGTRSTKGWVYGTLCGGFYLGNVYGSLVAVKIHNERLETDLLGRIEALVEKHLD